MPVFRPRQSQSKRRKRGMLLVVSATAVTLAAAACGGSSSSSNSATGGTAVNGGTAVVALPPSAQPSYIFPYINSANITNLNLFYLQGLMYRPLYWFGQNGQPTVNNTLSLANPPVIKGTKVTITLKHYMWSNGTPVTAQNVMFWLNMEQALPQDYGAYTGFPANVKDITVVSPTELTMTMDQAYSPLWFQYNELSQITPMPEAWDRTASGPSHCSTTASDCAKVYAYLDAQAKNFSGYVSSPLWSIVDGPWRLSAFNADGHITFVPNKSYTGPVKPRLAQLQEVPFTTDSAEYNVLESPSASGKIDWGYLPEQDAPEKPANAAVGANPLASHGYTLTPWYSWGINYYVMNLNSTTGNGPILSQLYFRQAMAYLMNQQAVIQGPLKGYGTITVGPVGSQPVTSFLSPQGRQGDPFPYNPTKAKSLLSSHGWKVTPGGTTTCTDPSLCGPGVKPGQPLSFTMTYATGTAWIDSEMSQLQSNAAAVGIRVALKPAPFTQVTALAGGNCKLIKAPCNYDLADWGGGWSFSPDYLPTGEELFACAAVANSSGYCDPSNDSLINKTLTSSNLQDMYTWQDYLATRLPLMWQPNAAYQLNEVANNLRGAAPFSPTLNITPEYWYFVK